jgi:hypothetical protein
VQVSTFLGLLLLLQNPSCGSEAVRHLADGVRRAEAFDLSGAADAYAAAAAAGCGVARPSAIYARGLIAARAAEAQFGSAASLQPLRLAIGSLEPYVAADPAARIMQDVLRAAMPAAQHERAEMALFIDEMLRRESLQLEAGLPGLPVLSAHEAAGFFWLQLHLYDEARRAFDVAARRIGQTPHVVVGLARTAAGAGDREAACGLYRQLLSWWGDRWGSPPEITEARGFVSDSRCASLSLGPGARP